MLTHILMISLACCGCAQAQVGAADCEKEALIWCSELRHEKLSQEDKVVLLSLTYWSWARSAMILQAQKAVAQYVHAAHVFIQKSMSGRINPVRLCSIAGCSTGEWAQMVTAYEHAHEILVEKLKSYRYASATYAQCIEYILKTDSTSPVVVAYVQKVREHARAHGLKNCASQATCLKDVMATLRKVFDSLSLSSHTRGLFDLVLNFANTDAFNSYAKFDKQYTQCNDLVWGSLERSYALGNIIWDINESERARFYWMHHRMLMRAFYDDDASGVMSAFNPEGFVSFEQRKHYMTVV